MSDITMEQIKSKINSFGSDNLKVCGGIYVGGIYSQQIPDELASVIRYILREQNIFKTKTMLEIGSASGASAYIFDYFFDLDHITIIDDNKHKNHSHRKKILKDVNYVEFIGDSHSQKALEFVASQNMCYDIILIDGDHSYKGVKSDFSMYYQFSEYLGIILLHDIVACLGVKKFFEELVEHCYPFDMKFVNKHISKEHPKPLGLGLFRSYNLCLKGA